MYIEQISNKDEVPGGFTHRLPGQVHARLMHPVANRRLAQSLKLRRTKLMMWIDEIAATAMNVDRREFPQRKGCALDVPPRTPGPPRGFPRRFVLERRLPDHRIEGMSLVGVMWVLAPPGSNRSHIHAAIAAHRTKRVGRLMVEVDRSVDRIRGLLLKELSDEPTNLRNCRSGARFTPWILNSESREIVVEASLLSESQIEIMDPITLGSL